MELLRTLDAQLARWGAAPILALAASGVALVGGVDFLTGYEVSVSIFYLGPVALAAWYAGRAAGVSVALLSCVSWYVADVAGGNQYSHPAIPVWNALIRLCFFLAVALLIDALQRSLRAQHLLARTDALTGLAGRRAFEERLAHDLALAQRRGSALTLAFLDLDGFKAVNDRHGHAAGDRLLEAAGRVLKGAVREVDTAARMGGDEFALILPDTDDRGARRVMDKLAHELRAALVALPGEASCSIGVVTFLDAATSPQGAVALADELMYQAKRRERGGAAFRVLGNPIPRPAAGAAQVARGGGQPPEQAEKPS